MASLPERWTSLRPHLEQKRLITSKSRFRLVPAGRRSGKTELAKRYTIKKGYKAHRYCSWPDPRYFFAAPTRDQAKAIFWSDLKSFIPMEDIAGKPSETELKIRLLNGTEFYVVGMDRPERIEGRPWDGGILDEYANMHSGAWEKNVRPSLADRGGWAWLIGVPEGRNHYYDLVQKALLDETGQWDVFTWKSSDILSSDEISSAKCDLDELTFKQEFEASFNTFAGRAYHAFDTKTHVGKLKYDQTHPLILTFDFNISPGTASVLQEQILPSGLRGTGVIGEVHIPTNSTTVSVCDKIIRDWGSHRGVVRCYGDATGGSGGSAKILGSDWDLIKMALRPVFGDRLEVKVSRSNPRERKRVNSVNSRFKSVSGDIRLMLSSSVPKTIQDFDGVRVLSGGSGEIDKKADPKLSHLSDGIGYYISQVFPIGDVSIGSKIVGMY